jgi:hypothetical protein
MLDARDRNMSLSCRLYFEFINYSDDAGQIKGLVE